MASNLRNPFKLTAGMNPPELIGRDAVFDEFAESLDNRPGAPDRLMRISGIRGIGKTVMLNALGDVAASKGFQVVNVASDAGFCDRIVRMVAPMAPLRAATIGPALRRLPDGQLSHLAAMAGRGERLASGGEVARAMGRDTKDVSASRRRLIDANIIEPLGYGKVGFAIPYLREYLLSHRDDILEDINDRLVF